MNINPISYYRTTIYIKVLRVIVITLLLLNGISALAGGYGLIADPSGAGVGMPLEILKYSPFNNFLLPGIILFIFNGIFSLAILIFVLTGYRHQELLILFEGCILGGWIGIQMIMLQQANFLHLACGLIAFALIFSGYFLYSLKINTIN